MEQRLVSSEDEMECLGKEMMRQWEAPCVIGLIGDLGAGKTHFTKGVARELGLTNVTSPTFNLVNEQRGERGTLFHFDFYRIKYEEELLDLGWDDYLTQTAVVVAEWANLYPQLMPDDTKWIKIEHQGEQRLVSFA